MRRPATLRVLDIETIPEGLPRGWRTDDPEREIPIPDEVAPKMPKTYKVGSEKYVAEHARRRIDAYRGWALNPWRCEVVAVGWVDLVREGGIWTRRDRVSFAGGEAEVLAECARAYLAGPPVGTWTTYDPRVLWARSVVQRLDLLRDHLAPVHRGRWYVTDKRVLDLAAPFGVIGDRKHYALAPLARLLDLGSADVDGSDVADLWLVDDLVALAEKPLQDADLTAGILLRSGLLDEFIP